MRTAARALIILAAASLGGCIQRTVTRVEVTPDRMTTVSSMRSATNLPARFTVVTPPATPGDCPGQLRDDELRATLRLHWSVLREVPDSAVYRAIGDYRVDPVGTYGDEPGEALRVDCARLSAVGIVKL